MNGDSINDFIIGEREGWVNFYKRSDDGTLDATVRLKTASGAFVKTHTNAAPAVADWNGDGLLDILISGEYASDNGGSLVKLYINKGTPQNYSFEDEQPLKTSDGQPIDQGLERTCIQVVDLDRNGTLDLVLGEGWHSKAGFIFFENVGTPTSPSLVRRDRLEQTDGSIVSVYLDAKPSFVDWNNDGIYDLLAAGKEDSIDLYFGEVQ